MQGNPVEHLDVGPVFDDQLLDEVEAVQFDLGGGQIGQVPATGWSRTARPLAAVQGATAAEDAVDGPHRGHRVARAYASQAAHILRR
jgi:hypothetical protein